MTDKNRTSTRRRNTNQRDGSLGDIIKDALKAEGKTAKDITVSPKRPTKKVLEKRLQWEHGELGSIRLAVNEFCLGFDASDGPNTWAHIPVKGQPSHLNVSIVQRLERGVKMYHVSDGSKLRCINRDEHIPTFQVPVTWQDNVPHTRRTDIDNIDLILVDKVGRFVQLQVSITTRNRKFFLNVQELFAGHVARTTVAKATQLGLTYVKADNGVAAIVVPLWPENAYPGADYLKTWNAIGEQLVRRALQGERSVTLSAATYAEWQPPELSRDRNENREYGVVTFFNLITGYGFLENADGVSYFVHFRDLVEMYAPQPMRTYSFEPSSNGGKLKALNVRAV